MGADSAAVSPGDERWLAALASEADRDDAAAELGRRLRAALGRSFSRTLGEDLDDLAQSAVLRVLERLDEFRGDSRFTTWATSIAVRMALGELRRRRYADRRSEQLVLDAEQQLGQTAEAPGHIQRAEAAAVVHHMITTELSETQRDALLAELSGLPLMEIARRSGRSRGALYKLLHDARKRLRAALEAKGLSAADLLEVHP